MVLPTAVGLGRLDPCPMLAVPEAAEPGKDRGAAVALDQGAGLVLAQGAQIAPGEHHHRLAAQEVVPGLRQAPADLVGGAGGVQLLQQLEGRDVARAG